MGFVTNLDRNGEANPIVAQLSNGILSGLESYANRNKDTRSLGTKFKDGIKEGYNEKLSPDASDSEKLKHQAFKLGGRKLIGSGIEFLTEL